MPFGPWETFEDCVAEMRAQYDEETAAKVCATLHHKVTGEWPGASKSEPAVRGQVGGPIVWKNARKQIAFGVVLVPGEPDADGDVVTKEQVEDYAHGYMEQFRLIDKQHSLDALDACPVESYTTPVELTVTVKGQDVTLPVGTWIMGTKIKDKAVWKQIEDGELEGYSIMGVNRRDFEAAMKSWPGVAKALPPQFKRVTMAELGQDDMLVPFVSLCKGPAVPKAMFFALKAHEESPTEGWWDKVKGIITSKEGRVLSAANRKKLEEAQRAISDVLRFADGTEEVQDMDEKVLHEAVGKAVADALQPITAKVEALEAAVAKDADQEQTVPDPVAEEVGQLKARITELEATAKAKDDEAEEFRKGVEERIKTLTAKARTQPRGESGQDDDTPPQAPVVSKDRDILGRKLKL